MDYLKIIYEEENGKATINEVYRYIGKAGVWALFGKKGEGFECLNVGRCVDVGREILYDISCLHNLTLPQDGNEEYINQFAELSGFKYKKKWTQEYLYPFISTLQYEAIMFVYVYNESAINKEKKFAWLTHAKFWRNGSAFKYAQNNFYENRREAVLKTKETIITVKSLEDLKGLLKKYDYYSSEENGSVK